ncbi:MAG: type IV pilus inner membrane component PilO [Gammaproteobacteria bacterium]
MNLNKLYEWPLSLRLLVMGLVSIVIFFALYIYDISNLSDKLQDAKQQEENIKQELDLILNKQASVQKDLAQFSQINKQLMDWRGKLISYSQLPELMDQILKIGAANHVSYTLFTPEPAVGLTAYFKVPEKPKTPTSSDTVIKTPKVSLLESNNQVIYYNVPIKLEATGSYEDLARVVSQIASLPMLVVINDFTMTKPANSDQQLTMKLMLEVYYLAN